MMLLHIPCTWIHVGKPNLVINDYSHLPILLLGNQSKTASTQLSRALGVGVGGRYFELCLIDEFNK